MKTKIHLIPRVVYDAVIVQSRKPEDVGRTLSASMSADKARRWKTNNGGLLVGFEITWLGGEPPKPGD
jgi:hypothetical protein